MPKGPNGEWRPAATGACAVHVMKIATGEIAETYAPPARDDVDHVENSQRASLGGKARATALTRERRLDIASSGANARWRS